MEENQEIDFSLFTDCYIRTGLDWHLSVLSPVCPDCAAMHNHSSILSRGTSHQNLHTYIYKHVNVYDFNWSAEQMSVVSVSLSALQAPMSRDDRWLFHAKNVHTQKNYKYVHKWHIHELKWMEIALQNSSFSLRRPPPVSFIMLPFHVSFIYGSFGELWRLDPHQGSGFLGDQRNGMENVLNVSNSDTASSVGSGLKGLWAVKWVRGKRDVVIFTSAKKKCHPG